MNEAKPTISFWKAITPIIYLAVALIVTLKIWDGDPHLPILSAAILSAFIGVLSGFKWKEIEDGIVKTISMSMSAILILMFIGMIIGVWILAGIVPTM
ncbi:MAG: sodium:proton antiporter, partial [Candidatus Marinimicrobia bacterium]|nr:sodium:proton antiporter [Candidatus Neomarinimicrobiota bacterium]